MATTANNATRPIFRDRDSFKRRTGQAIERPYIMLGMKTAAQIGHLSITRLTGRAQCWDSTVR